ncbi:LacI family DNA-binding transcriptional regulator [Sediminispirochaeta bajacaliforniensis]|uniref:LacI family DNA-binding transcriptional regulator n=1 Tax=Sediminispirochaeta bajacaliforniensis TaxID=148 RepID=UPI00036956A3|nr:LacI family DNA-binding transcriptional regulator [Sediminispirochaeta bajacaliforniensis]
MEKKATLQDVAQLAGCSKSTVSFVLNGRPGISETTRNKVLAACSKLGYGRFDIPTGDATTRICCIDVVRDSFISEPKLFEFKSFYLRGIQKRCGELNILLETISLYDLDKEKLKMALAGFTDVSGIIVMGSDLQSEADFGIFEIINIPIVFIDTFYPSLKYSFINVDNRSGMALLLSYLKQLRHQQVGLISINTINYNIRDREEAFIDTMRHSALSFQEEWFFKFSMANENDLYSYIERLKEANRLPSAFICTTDLIPIQLFPIFSKLAIHVPQDISVVSYGDLSLGQIIRPQLTSIDPPKNQIGRAAVELIVNQLDVSNRPENLGYHLNPERVLVSNNLIVRESAAEWEN